MIRNWNHEESAALGGADACAPYGEVLERQQTGCMGLVEAFPRSDVESVVCW